MCSESEDNLLPHHQQQPLCTNRLPYRQGRTLTAVKVYSINNESNHLLVFGVPSLNLRQEAKALLSKFGRLTSFVLTQLKGEDFTETYHAVYERIQSARVCKRMLDTKTFYGSSLHVCYAPEYESVMETKHKLLQRRRDVLFRLKRLDIEKAPEKADDSSQVITTEANNKLNMGEINVISVGTSHVQKKRKNVEVTAAEVIYKDCFVDCKDVSDKTVVDFNDRRVIDESDSKRKKVDTKTYDFNVENNSRIIDVVDCTSTEIETVTNINEALNYNNFGNEVVKSVPKKPLNKIQFSLKNKNLLI